jgi:phosphatidate cytidylyltransferase
MSAPKANSGRWSDLAARVASAAVMVIVGFWTMWMGQHVFHVFVALICGAMVWELVRMTTPEARQVAVQLGGLSGAAVLLAAYLPAGFAIPVLLAPVLVGLGQLSRHRIIFLIYAILVLLAGFGMILVRDDLGFVWILWLVLVVVVTDIAGYFAGRMIGGPKFWPSISPKKTWSGTVAGWIGAAIIGLTFTGYAEAGNGLIALSMAVSLASQMGDIAESAIKRKMGIKDSSNLIPGHGGVLDRCDGMLGAAVFLLLIGLAFGFPPGLG